MLELANNVHNTYKNSNAELADCKKLLVIVDAIEALYQNLSIKLDDSYIIGNLAPSGNLTGTYKDVIGTVPDAIKRTRNLFCKKECWPNQGELVSRNILYLLNKGKFHHDLTEIIGKYLDELKNIANGQI